MNCGMTKIDIINWSDNPAILIENALSPQKLFLLWLIRMRRKQALLYRIISFPLQSVKEGQNARLAARLTGYKIDIKSETQAIESGELPENYMELGEGVYEEDVYDENEEYPEDTDVRSRYRSGKMKQKLMFSRKKTGEEA